MWRWLAVFLFGAVLGAAFGVALGFFLTAKRAAATGK